MKPVLLPPAQPLVGEGGRPTPVFYDFLRELYDYTGGIETEQNSRVSALVSDLGGSPTNAEIATAFNDLLSKLKAAGLMETS